MRAPERLAIVNMSGVLRSLPPAARRTLAEMTQVERFENGSLICERGDPADAVFIVARGAVAVSLDASGRTVRELAAGALVGEYGALTNQRRTASLRAKGDVVLLRIDNERFGLFLHQFPTAMWALFSHAVQRLVQLEGRLRLDLENDPT